MAQTPQAEWTVGIEVAAQTEQPPPAGDQGMPGGFGNPTTLLLLIVAAGFLWWSMRRRRAFEERLREQRRIETITNAEQSAQNVANIMRAAPPPGAAAAAAAEGLASAARMPATERPVETQRERQEDAAPSVPDVEAAASDEERARLIERTEAVAQAEQAAAEQALRAARAAELAEESEARRLAAAKSAAEEARADTVDALQAQAVVGAAEPEIQERAAADALRAGLRELDNEPEEPLGAIAGDGTAICPPGFPVKGDAQARVYHEPGQVSYPPAVAEFCFASAEAAEAAGFRQARARGERSQE